MNAVREIDIIIDFLTDTSGARQAQREMQNLTGATQAATQAGQAMGNGYTQSYNRWRQEQRLLSDEARAMQREMSHGWMQNTEAFIAAREAMIRAQYGYHRLAMAGDQYNGTTETMMNQIYALGDAQRRARDAAVNNNVQMRRSFMEQAGMFANMTTQAERISANYDRMRNPLLLLNQGHLALAAGLNRIANNGNAANLALRQLGPTASTKQLNDHIMMINQGLMRFQFVAIGSGITALGLGYIMHKLSMMNEEYSSSLNTMLWTVYNALQPMLTVFREIAMGIFNTITAIAEWVIAFNNANPVLARFIQGMMLLAPLITFLLSPLAIGIGLFGGFQAALFALWAFIGPMVTGLAAMTATVWLVCAALIALYMYFIATGETADNFRAKVDGALSMLKDKFVEVFGFAIPYLQQFGEVIKEVFGNVIKAVTDAMAGDFEGLKELFAQILPTLIGFMLGGIPGLIFAAARLIPLIGQTMENSVGGAEGFIGNVVNKIVDFLENQLPQIVQVGINILMKLIEGIIQYIPMLGEVAVNVITGWVQLITGLLPIIVEAGVRLLTALLQGIIDTLPALFDAALQIINQVIIALTELLPMIIEIGGNLLVTLIDGIVQMLPMLVDTAIQLIQTLLDALIQLLPSIVMLGIELLMKLVVGIVEALPNLIAAAIKIIFSLQQTIIGLLPEILQLGITILKELVLGLLNIIGEIAIAAGKIIVEFVNKIISYDWISLGKDIVRGLISGISNMAGALGDAAIGMANKVGGTVKKFFGIASPSKLMKQYGEFVGEGFEIGLVAKTADVRNAAGYMASSSLGEFSTEATAAQSVANNTTSNSTSNSNSVTINIDGQKATGGQVGNFERAVLDLMDSYFDTQNTLLER